MYFVHTQSVGGCGDISARRALMLATEAERSPFPADTASDTRRCERCRSGKDVQLWRQGDAAAVEGDRLADRSWAIF